MNRTALLSVWLALPLAAAAQTKPATTTAKTTAPQQVTEVTEDIDPATGKVIRRTTRTTTLPAGSTAPSTMPSTAAPSSTDAADSAPVSPATDAAVSDFFREKTAVSRLTSTQLLSAYSRFIEQVRDERHGWNATNWYKAATVLSSLNARYNQLRDSYSLDDKLTIRSQQAEFQALRTARQLSDQVSDKL